MTLMVSGGHARQLVDWDAIGYAVALSPTIPTPGISEIVKLFLSYTELDLFYAGGM